MLFFKIYVLGVAFLVAALMVNGGAKLLSLPSWYDFLAQPQFTIKSVLWLFVGYPFLLGVITYLLHKFL